MHRRTLGRTGFAIAPIGFGTWVTGGGGYRWGWSEPLEDDESVAAIHRALEHGVNWIDTAPLYGLGRAEEVVARALAGIAERPYVFTKCGLRWDEAGESFPVLSADSIREEAEDSLRRLRVDVIDLLQIHWPIPDADLEEAWGTLSDLKAEGKVRCIGGSNFSVDQVRRAQAIAPLDSLQTQYSLIDRGAEGELLPFCAEHGIGVLAYAPMGSSLLTGAMTRERVLGLADDDWRRQDERFQEPALSRNLALAECLRQVGARHGRSAGEAAVAWALRDDVVTGAIVGFRRPAQVDGIVAGADLRLGDDDLAEIEAVSRGAA